MSRLSLLLSLLAALLLLASPALANEAAGSADPARKAAEEMVQQLADAYPRARAIWEDLRATPKLVTGLEVPAEGDSPEVRAQAFLGQHAAIVGVPVTGLVAEDTTRAKGRTTVRFSHRHLGVPVLDREVVVTMDMWGTVLTMANDALPVGDIADARVDGLAARNAALTSVGLGEGDLERSSATEAIQIAGGKATRVWVVKVLKAELSEHLRVLVDASTGAIVQKKNLAQR